MSARDPRLNCPFSEDKIFPFDWIRWIRLDLLRKLSLYRFTFSKLQRSDFPAFRICFLFSISCFPISVFLTKTKIKFSRKKSERSFKTRLDNASRPVRNYRKLLVHYWQALLKDSRFEYRFSSWKRDRKDGEFLRLGSIARLNPENQERIRSRCQLSRFSFS